ncbi:hypothetical protein CFII64_15587 [Pseudomonas sp. CFII64]|nr:hypothetical protein CFII64_15587 [Pseudomonas sp. CFII64]
MIYLKLKGEEKRALKIIWPASPPHGDGEAGQMILRSIFGRESGRRKGQIYS